MQYHIITYGCQMNKNDSERIAAVLEETGFKKAEDKNSADIIIVNTCSVRQTAEDRVFGLIEVIKRHHNAKKRQNEKSFTPLIAITGCMIGRDKDGLLRKKLKEKGVDLFFKIDELPLLPKLITDIQQNPKFQMLNTKIFENFGIRNFIGNWKLEIGNSDIKANTSTDVPYLAIFPQSSTSVSRYLTIQTGCNEFCSYCVVPYSRGREYYRPLKEILKEAKKIIEECNNNSVSDFGSERRNVPKGTRRIIEGNSACQIILLGQIVNKWQAPDPENFSKNNPFVLNQKRVSIESSRQMSSRPCRELRSENSKQNSKFNHFAALLWELNQLKGLETINFTSPHPSYMTDEVVKALTLPKMANYLHLPVQSGDDEILKKMNRKYTVADYLKIIEKIRKVKPNIELGTDIIVGFPGETEKQFQNTVKLCKKVKFNVAYIAMYSPRPGTMAYKNFLDDVPREVKKERWNILNDLINNRNK